MEEPNNTTQLFCEHIFYRGFWITNSRKDYQKEAGPISSWRCFHFSDFTFYLHPKTIIYQLNQNNRLFFLIGHAYNPYQMEANEDTILRNLSCCYGTGSYQDLLDELTGVYITGVIEDERIEFQLDASGMQYACYGNIGQDFNIASHMRLFEDLCGLETSEYTRRLTNYRWYHFMMGNYLPGNLTCFDNIKRVIPNTSISYDGNTTTITRFYPSHPIKMAETKEEYDAIIAEGARILHNTMELIAQKWARPAISLTGGIDSNTTFAAANGLYDKFETFSYISMEREAIDAEKAAEISRRFHVRHTVYHIPSDNSEVNDFTLFKHIFEHNDGDIGQYKDDDIRKKITLIKNDVCDVEVKSWISETIRAYAYKYFGKMHFPKSLSPRNYTSLYKIFLFNRRLVHETDRYFADYLKETNLKSHLFNYDETDIFVWEMMHGGKCGLNIGVMKQCFDITIPYNNRKFLDTLLRVPLEYRISDQHHLDLKKIMNPELYEMGIRVINQNETKARKKMIGLYFGINSFLPF